MSSNEGRLHLARIIDALGDRGEDAAVLAFEQEGKRQLTGGDLASLARRFAAGLQDYGLEPGARVGLVAESSPEAIAALLGILASRCVAVPLDVQMGEETMERVLQDSGAELVLTTRQRRKRLAEAVGQRVQLFVLDSQTTGDQSRGDGDGYDPQEASSETRTRRWDELLGAERDLSFPHRQADEDPEALADETAVLFYTSGTTGPPKGVPLTHRNLLAQIDTVSRAKLTQPDDRVLLPLPLHHVYPFVIGMLTPLSLGLPIILPRSLTGPDVVKALRDGEVTVLIGVPRLYRALYDAIISQAKSSVGDAGSRMLKHAVDWSGWVRQQSSLPVGDAAFAPLQHQFAPKLRVLASGGSPLDPDLAWRLEGLGWKVAIGYGLTETSPLLTMHMPGEDHLDTVGRPIDDIDLRIDPHWREKENDEDEDEAGDENPSSDAGQESDDEPAEGEILAKGPSVFSGYWNLPEKTKKAFTEDGWFRTGDLGFLDSDNRLHVTGRASTLIITEQGEKVQPDEVESAYAEADPIREIGILQRDRKLVGLVVPETKKISDAQDMEQVVRDAIQKQGERLPSYQRLHDVLVTRKPLPRTRIGKIRRHQLKELFEEAESGEGQSAEPIAIEDMSAQDRSLLDQRTARKVWDLLTERFSDQPLSPDSDLRTDMGVDSMEWLNLTMEIMQRTGVELDDETVARTESVRELLQEISRTAGVETNADLLEDPEQVLDDQQRHRLQPLGPAASFVARHGFGANRRLVRWFLKLQVAGLDHVPTSGPFVIAANHLSHLDPFVLSASLRPEQLSETYWAAWVGATRRNPVTRLAGRLAKTIPIDPKRGVISSLAFGAAVLERDSILVWFPEGQRSESGELQPLRPGLGMLLAKYKVPVVPTHIEGTYEALPPGSRKLRRHTVNIRFAKPLMPDELEQRGEGEGTPEKIVDALRQQLERCDKDDAAGR